MCPNTSRHLHWVQVFDTFTLGSTYSRWDRHVHIGLNMFELGPRCAGIVLCTGAQVGGGVS